MSGGSVSPDPAVARFTVGPVSVGSKGSIAPDPVVARFTVPPQTVVLSDRIDAKVTPAPKPPQWRRWFGVAWRAAIALHELGHHGQDVWEHVRGLWELLKRGRRHETKDAI